MGNTIRKLIYLTLIFIVASCNNVEMPSDKEKTMVETANSSLDIISFETPFNQSQQMAGDIIHVTFKNSDNSIAIDSVLVFDENMPIGKLLNIADTLVWDTKEIRVGIRQIKSISYYNGTIETDRIKVRFNSNIIPEQYTYRVVKEYPHDKTAYTQGLIFEEGFLYEGTGQYGESQLRKVKLETGELLQTYNLPSSVFGEGIVRFEDKIIQLTWRTMIGYIYEFDGFKLLKTFNLPSEGWGITTDGKKLFMTDGSEIMYILDPYSLSVTDKMYVYNEEGSVKDLNELEYINGYIYANVYQTDYIIKIDPLTGKIVAEMNLEGILSERDRKGIKVDVLNGIAYDVKGNRIFVTGKWWPKLFEVEFLKVE